jgi:LDH2 family malate/lactate/ureidoglycolate dehydrogenase
MRITKNLLQTRLNQLFLELNVTELAASQVIDAILDAEMSGVHTHGLALLPGMIDNLMNGSISPSAIPIKGRVSVNRLAIDGEACFGVVTGNAAVKQVIDLTAKHGSSIVTIKNMQHWGRAAYYAEKIAAAGNICIILVATTPLMLLHGSKSVKIGNNILCVAIPPTTNTNPLTLDLCTSLLSYGKICEMAHAGIKSSVPLGINQAGALTNDPDDIAKGGSLFPLAANKGSGLALMIELFVTMFTGVYQSFQENLKTAAKRGSNHCDAVMIIGMRQEQIPHLQLAAEQLQNLRTAITREADCEMIFLPGERSRQTKIESESQGIWISPYVRSFLQKNLLTRGIIEGL